MDENSLHGHVCICTEGLGLAKEKYKMTTAVIQRELSHVKVRHKGKKKKSKTEEKEEEQLNIIKRERSKRREDTSKHTLGGT